MIIESLAAIVGGAHLQTDEAARRRAAEDVFTSENVALPDLVVSPASHDETVRVMRVLAEARAAVVPRGGGLSYTGGISPGLPAVVLDLTRLTSIQIFAEDRYAIVGAGTSWEALAEALRPHRLRPLMSGPISGSHSTIGGAVAQNMPGSMDGILGVTAVLSDGTVVRTGGAAIGAHFWRHHGPDLTGIFLGDCGAFAVRTEIVLRLVADRDAAFASFAYETPQALLATLVEMLRANAISRAFGLDQVKAEGATRVDFGEGMKALGAVMSRADSVSGAMRDAAKLVRAGIAPRAASGGKWSLHLTVEANSPAAAAEQIVCVQTIAGRDGVAIDDVLPRTLRAKPFSIRGIVGPEGERFVPLHGILPLSRAEAARAALADALAGEAAALAEAGVRIHWHFSSLGGAYVVIEPMFYWRDALDAVQFEHLSERNRARFGAFAPDPAARALVRRMRGELTAILDRHGAAHAQLGRYYNYVDRLDPGSRDLVSRIKSALDPEGRMNPGVLGLPPR
jgi:D-lactate dehydrogenase (cytochrome)